MKFTDSGALPVAGVPVALADSGVAPCTQKSSNGSPRAAWSSGHGNVFSPRLSFGLMMPDFTFSIVRSIAASTLLVVYATWLM